MSDPQVVWTYEETRMRTSAGVLAYRSGVWDTEREELDTPAILMTPEYRAELRSLLAYRETGSAEGVMNAMAAAIERMLEATE